MTEAEELTETTYLDAVAGALQIVDEVGGACVPMGNDICHNTMMGEEERQAKARHLQGRGRRGVATS